MPEKDANKCHTARTQPVSREMWQHVRSGTRPMAPDFKRREIISSELTRVGSRDASKKHQVEGVPQMQSWGRGALHID